MKKVQKERPEPPKIEMMFNEINVIWVEREGKQSRDVKKFVTVPDMATAKIKLEHERCRWFLLLVQRYINHQMQILVLPGSINTEWSRLNRKPTGIVQKIVSKLLMVEELTTFEMAICVERFLLPAFVTCNPGEVYRYWPQWERLECNMREWVKKHGRTIESFAEFNMSIQSRLSEKKQVGLYQLQDALSHVLN